MKKRFSLIGALLITINALLGFTLAGGLFLNVATANYTIDETSYFEAEDDGHLFKCYTIEGEATSIAIAWLHSETNIVPANLTIPSTITSDALTGEGNFVDYTVVAIAKGGFRRCGFTTITLPTTITEIREEAFAYCMNMTSFTFPAGITEIAPSTFLDCRDLETIYYKNSVGNRVLSNDSITRIGDHAFDSCIKLENIYCPTNVTFFGHSCFQKCTNLLSFNLPNDKGTNTITIESFAFADCDRLASFYFEENVTTIEDYAFADCHPDLTFKYTGSTIPTFSEKWRHKLITTSSSAVYDILLDQSQIIQHPDYPGLFYTIDTADVKLDNARTNNTSIYVLQNSEPYASIYEFHAPFDSQTGYYDKPNGILTIPNTIRVDGVDYTVKIIKEYAFANNLELQHIIFNEDLVQIQNHAFFHDTNIHTLDFTDCEELVEISYAIFQDVTLKANAAANYPDNADTKSDDAGVSAQTFNSVMTSITLPNCLQYIGNFAFYNFINLVDGIFFKTDNSQPSQLKMIGDYAFAVHQGKDFNSSLSKKEVDLVLPNSLDDSYASQALFFHSYTYEKPKSPNTINGSIKNRYAVGKNAFDNQLVLRSVTMEPANNGLSCSFGSNVFVRCKNMIRFKGNINMYLMGNDMFKDCASLREVFFSSTRSEAGSLNYPWGIEDTSDNYSNSIFMGANTKPELVIYVNGPHAPKSLYTSPKGGTNAWNVEAGPSFVNELNYSSDATNGSIRTCIPTFYNIDWMNEDDVIYWKYNKNNNVYDCAHPVTLDDYKSGIIALVKDTTTNKFTVAKYFTDGGSNNVSDEIDLTTVAISNDIDTIGQEAFAADGNGRNSGYYFTLPTSVTKISERAFYRKSVRGVRIVTYKVSGTQKVPTGEVRTYAQIKSAIASAQDANRVGYCCLPPSVLRVERNAFYNNIFGSIEIGASVNYLGNSAFYMHPNGSNASNLRGTVTSITIDGGNSYFESINDGIYYTANAAKKTLLYQSNGVTGALTVDDDTIAIGFRAAASTKYSSVAFPSSLTTIYGCAFKNCYNLTTITGLSSIKYISAYADSGEEVYNTSLPFDNIDFRDIARADTHKDKTLPARFGSFQNCKALTTVDFTSMSSLKKIGWASFSGCTTLSNMANGATYNFYGTVTSNPTTVNSGVLDLSQCSNLRIVDKEAFSGCNAINYIILPNSTGSNHSAESQMYYGKDPNGNTNANRPFIIGPKVLCGETHQQADQNGTAPNKTSHYPTIKVNNVTQNIIANYDSLYYRVHTTDDLYTGNKTGRKYWTVTTTGEYHLFENYDEAKDWLDVTANFNSQAD